MKKSIFLLLVIILNFSCSDRNEGDWDDNIKLSQKEIQFNALENSTIVTTEGDWWWVSEIFFENKTVFGLNDMDTTSNEFIIVESEFTVERKNGKEIHISLAKNTTGLERILTVGLQAGNYFDAISITQSAE